VSSEGTHQVVMLFLSPVEGCLLKGAMSRFVHIEKSSLNFSNSTFVIRVNLLHP